MKMERGTAFNGRETEPGRSTFVLSGDEWRVFTAACLRVGVEPTGESYWQWRLREGAFSAASR